MEYTDFRVWNVDLGFKGQNPVSRNGSTSISHQHSEIINDTCSTTPRALVFITGKAIEI